MAAAPDLIEFHRDDPSEVVAVMAELASSRDGWVNLSPEVDPEAELPRPPGLFGFFATRGPAVPLATWLPGPESRRGVEPISVGLSHSLGGKVLVRLRETGTTVPAGWTVVQDTRRGLVLHVPEAPDEAEVLGWLLDVVAALCPAPLTGHWQAAVHRRSR